ncbi:MAG: hypothetical protein Sapg2KO_12610 [Saprospiraceae bacterium]
MIRFCYLILGFGLLFSCQPKKDTVTSETEQPIAPAKIVFNDTIPTPEGFTVLLEAEGDLDKDRQAEKVVIYDTPIETEMGTERAIHIFRKGPENWMLWHKTTGGILSSGHGGMFGDPLNDVRIERGCIVLEHFGGSRQKWAYLHRYRFQNEDWELIGTTVGFGVPCESWETFDYNLSTGNLDYKLEQEKCGDEGGTSKVLKKESFTLTQDDLPSMDSMYPGNNGVEIPNTDLVFYY